MVKPLTFWLLLALILGCAFFNVRADEGEDFEEFEESEDGFEIEEEEEEFEEEEEEFDEEFADSENKIIETAFIIPDYPDMVLPIGDEVTALISVKNFGDEPYNFTYVGGSIQSVFDLTYFIQNFTATPIGLVVEPKEEATIEFKFTPDKSLEPLEFWISSWLLYNSTDGYGRVDVQYPINRTCELVPGSGAANETMINYTIGATVFIIGLYAATLFMGGKKTYVADKPKKKSTGKPSSWTQDIYKPSSTSRSVGNKRRKSSRKKD